MRTTLTLDDDLAAALKERAFKSGNSFKQVVNSVLRMGLAAKDRPRKQPYKLSPVSMGWPKSPLNLDKALRLASILEDEETQQEMEVRR